MRLSRDSNGIVVNDGDRVGNDLISMSPAECEIPKAIVEILLNMVRRRGEFTCTKVRARRTSGAPVGNPGAAASATGPGCGRCPV
jgi:hypothetical protein